MDFDDFFAAEGPRLVRMCWLLTLDRQVAADVAQETMTRAWSSWPKLSQADENPGAWASTVALNLVRSRGRRLARRRQVDTARSDVPPRQSVSDPDVLAAIRGLSDRQREVVVLRYWLDWTLPRCAEAMGVTVGSAKQHLTRAHSNLELVLDPTDLKELEL